MPQQHLLGWRDLCRQGHELGLELFSMGVSMLGITSMIACTRGFLLTALATAILVGVSPAPSFAEECRWFGTRPFCDGQCPSGWRYTGHREACTTGSRRLCCRGGSGGRPPMGGAVNLCKSNFCADLSWEGGSTISIRLRSFPRSTHRNIRGANGQQVQGDSATFPGRHISVQACNRSTFGSSACTAWVTFSH
jgi:hypothetical protein